MAATMLKLAYVLLTAGLIYQVATAPAKKDEKPSPVASIKDGAKTIYDNLSAGLGKHFPNSTRAIAGFFNGSQQTAKDVEWFIKNIKVQAENLNEFRVFATTISEAIAKRFDEFNKFASAQGDIKEQIKENVEKWQEALGKVISSDQISDAQEGVLALGKEFSNTFVNGAKTFRENFDKLLKSSK